MILVKTLQRADGWDMFIGPETRKIKPAGLLIERFIFSQDRKGIRKSFGKFCKITVLKLSPYLFDVIEEE